MIHFMFKKNILLFILCILTASALKAGEIKFNLPIAAHHTASRDDGGKWNEFFLDDAALGASYKHDTNLGFSVNQSKNSYDDNRSVYVTLDYLPTVYQKGIFKINTGGHVGFATGYDKLSKSGIIPFLGFGLEAEVANVSFETIVTPPYKTAPLTLIFLAKFKLWDSQQGLTY